MSEIKTFFRHCPSCGKRFEIRLTGKEIVESKTVKEDLPVTRKAFIPSPGSYLLLGESDPVTIEIDKFLYSYKCKHCGHEWTENHQEEHEL